MNEEILQESVSENETEYLENEENVQENKDIILEDQENIEDKTQDDIFLEESVSGNFTEDVEPDHEILVPLPDDSVSNNSVSGNTISGNDFFMDSDQGDNLELLSRDEFMYSMQSLSVSDELPLMQSDINSLSSTDTLLLLILCLLLGHFIHVVFKGSHWFRKL